LNAAFLNGLILVLIIDIWWPPLKYVMQVT